MIKPKICIDPGHGGWDPGAFKNGLIEKDINLIVATKLAKLLIYNGFDVKLTRTTDVYLTLAERSKIANDFGAEVFISDHHNAGGGDGWEVIHSIIAGPDDKLAKLIGAEFSRFQNKHSVGTYSRASTTDPAKDYYAVLRNTKAPARVITEYAYLDSLDYTIIDTLAEQVREAYLIAIAVCKFYGKTFKDII